MCHIFSKQYYNNTYSEEVFEEKHTGSLFSPLKDFTGPQDLSFGWKLYIIFLSMTDIGKR